MDKVLRFLFETYWLLGVFEEFGVIRRENYGFGIILLLSDLRLFILVDLLGLIF